METAILRIILSMLEFFAGTFLYVLKRHIIYLTVGFDAFWSGASLAYWIEAHPTTVWNHLASHSSPQAIFSIFDMVCTSGIQFPVKGIEYFRSSKSKNIACGGRFQGMLSQLRNSYIFFLQGMLSQLRNFYIRASQKHGGKFARGRETFYQLPMA